MWSIKFLAAAHQRGYRDVITGVVTVPPSEESIDISTENGKKLYKAREANDKAYSDLVLSCSGEICFEIVAGAVTPDLQEGDARLAWRKLKEKYMPTTSANKVDLAAQFANSKLTSWKSNPDLWISKLEILRARLASCNQVIDETGLIIHILNNVPSKYDNVVENLEKRLNLSEPLLLEEVRSDLMLKYTKLKLRAKEGGEKGFDSDSEDDGDESALVAGGGGGGNKWNSNKFKGFCNRCGKQGHKAIDCKENVSSNNGSKRFNGKCYYCGVWGHKKSDCHKKKADNAKKNNSENANVVGYDEEVALICTEISVPQVRNDFLGVSERKLKLHEENELALTQVDCLGKSEKVNFSDDYGSFDNMKDDVWILDSGASAHVTYSKVGMINLKPIDKKIKVGNGKHVQATHIGTKIGTVFFEHRATKIRIEEVLLVPEMYCNLISATKLMANGCTITGIENVITIEKKGKKFYCDHRIKSGSGQLLGIKIMQQEKELPGKKTVLKATYRGAIESAHHVLGHPGDNFISETAEKFGLKIGEKGPCEACIVSKIRKKNVKKISSKKSEIVGGRVFFDSSSIKNKSAGGSKYWILFVDEATGYKKSYFVKQKSEMSKIGEKYLTFLKKKGIEVKKLRCDDAGENKKFEKWVEKSNFNIDFEFTGANTPQHNGVVERGFATLTGRLRAMMKQAGLSEELKYKLWAECAKTVTDLDGLLISKKGEKSSFEKFFKDQQKFTSNLHSFGEIGIVLAKKKIKSKLADRGFAALFVGYAENHAGDVFKMFNPKTFKVTLTRDVRFLGKYYGEYEQLKPGNSPDIDDDFDGTENKSKKIQFSDEKSPERRNQDEEDFEIRVEDVVEESTQIEDRPRTRSSGPVTNEEGDVEYSGKLRRAMAKLHDTWNPTLGDMVELAFVGGSDDTYDNPKTFQEAWNHPDLEERKKWREAIRKEFNDMIYKRKVWRHVKKSTIPNNRRLIGCKWVFKKKGNGVYRARLCAIGYTQVPGIDHGFAFAPVVGETTFRLVLVIGLFNGWIMEIVDVETAFLYGDLEEEIFMRIPEGMDLFTGKSYEADEALLLQQAMYGLVQAARQFFKKLRDTMVNYMGFTKCLSDQCLLVKNDEFGTVIVCLYIDDTMVVGDKKAVGKFKSDLAKHFSTKEEGAMTEYVGCMVKSLNGGLYLHQSALIKKIERNFGERVQKLRRYSTPGTPGQGLVQVKDNEKVLNEKDQTEYRSGVGMLLFLTKFSRPDIANAVRELSKVNNKACEAHVKELLRVIKFVIDTRFWSLRYRINDDDRKIQNWKLKAYSDSDFAGDKDTRLSVSGYGIYLFNCLVSWKSRAMRTHALSSTEAEYIAVSEVLCEILFIRQVLEFMGVKIEYPIVIHCDNIGAIFLAHNAKVSSRTKHIQLKTHFIREYVDK